MYALTPCPPQDGTLEERRVGENRCAAYHGWIQHVDIHAIRREVLIMIGPGTQPGPARWAIWTVSVPELCVSRSRDRLKYRHLIAHSRTQQLVTASPFHYLYTLRSPGHDLGKSHIQGRAVSSALSSLQPSQLLGVRCAAHVPKALSQSTHGSSQCLRFKRLHDSRAYASTVAQILQRCLLFRLTLDHYA